MQDGNVRLRESIAELEHALASDGYTWNAVDRHVDELVAHANLCRTRVDLPPGAFRDFVARAARMTRRSRIVQDIVFTSDTVRTAACNALHDLIMEGV